MQNTESAVPNTYEPLNTLAFWLKEGDTILTGKAVGRDVGEVKANLQDIMQECGEVADFLPRLKGHVRAQSIQNAITGQQQRGRFSQAPSYGERQPQEIAR